MKLIKINTDHYIIVDDSEIKEGDYHFDFDKNEIHTWKGNLHSNRLKCKKITHSTEPLEVKITDEGIHLPDWSKIKALSPRVVKELLGEVDVEKKAREIVINNNPFGSENFSVSTFNGLVKDITKAIEDNKEKKWTDEDVIRIVEKSRATGLTAEYIIQSLQQKTEWEVEIIDEKLKLKQ